MDTPLYKYRCPLICLLLALVTLVTFWPVLKHEFVKYDDDKYITDNPHVKGGITFRSIYWAFANPHFYMWHPFASLSQMLDCELFGLNPAGHHLTSLLLHTANVLLVFWILRMLTGAVWRSAFVAAVFALHPLQVDSVAWLAERKNVLSTLFWMLTIAAYVRYVTHPSVVRYLLVVLVLCLGLMSKPTVITLPFALLLLDFWPLGRLRWPARRAGQDHSGLRQRSQEKTKDLSQLESAKHRYEQVSAWRLVGEKIPLLIPAAAVSVITYIAQQRGGVVSQFESVPLGHRLANATISYVTYIEKMMWPSRLAVFYPHPDGNFSVTRVVVSAVILVSISICVIYAARRRYLAVGWLWFLGILVPVIGLVQAGGQARADRYMYVPMIGLLIIVAWGVNDLTARWRYRNIIPVLAVAVLPAAAVCTRLQLKHWQNSETLFKHTLSVTRNNYVMHNNYANLLKDLGRTCEAIEHYTRCLELRSDLPEVHNNLGNALAAMGETDQAIAHYRKAIELTKSSKVKAGPPPGLAEAHYNLANALRLQGHFEQALEHYTEALKLRPNDADTLQGLGVTMSSLQRFDEAIEYYNRLLELESDNVIAHGLLGMALAGKGDTHSAIEQFRIVLSRRPDDVEMYCNLGLLLERQNNISEAITQYRRALQINPNYTKARQFLEAAVAKQEKPRTEQ
jgi:tetratricopeptide (TPR) repeat protein